MKNKIIRWCGLMLLPGALMLGSGCQSIPPLAAQQAGYPAEKVDARALFVESCAKCHGTNGRARTFRGWLLGAQNLTDPQWQAKSTDKELVNAIKTGPKAMPAFEKKLSASEIEALVAYVRTFGPAPTHD